MSFVARFSYVAELEQCADEKDMQVLNGEKFVNKCFVDCEDWINQEIRKKDSTTKPPHPPSERSNSSVNQK
jgi:hypothetical protein